MKRILLILLIALAGNATSAQKKSVLSKNLTVTVSFIPDSSLAIQTKEEKIYILVPDEDIDAIFTTSSSELFTEIISKIPDLKGDTLQIRGTRLGSLSKIYSQQFKWYANKYKKRGLELNGETNVYRISGYKIVSPIPAASKAASVEIKTEVTTQPIAAQAATQPTATQATTDTAKTQVNWKMCWDAASKSYKPCTN